MISRNATCQHLVEAFFAVRWMPMKGKDESGSVSSSDAVNPRKCLLDLALVTARLSVCSCATFLVLCNESETCKVPSPVKSLAS
eukprot:1078144-Amphidinium_carterae.2